MNSRLTALLLLSITAAPVGAVTVGVSNLAQSDQSTTMVGRLLGTQEYRFATSFTTGPGSFTLESVTFPFGMLVGEASGYSVAIYSAVSTSGPSGLVTTLFGNSIPFNNLETYSPSLTTTLVGSTTYWLVEQATATAPGSAFGSIFTGSPTEDTGGLPGWSISDDRWVTNDGGTVWFQARNGSPRQFSIQVSPVPDGGPNFVLLGVCLVTLALLRRKG